MSFIRFVVLCVFRDAGRILVGRGYDDIEDEAFLRPLGGSVEFGETAVDAIRREIREELHAEIADPVLLGVLESSARDRPVVSEHVGRALGEIGR